MATDRTKASSHMICIYAQGYCFHNSVRRRRFSTTLKEGLTPSEISEPQLSHSCHFPEKGNPTSGQIPFEYFDGIEAGDTNTHGLPPSYPSHLWSLQPQSGSISTALNLCSGNRWEYRSAIAKVECPRISPTVLSGTPTITICEAAVCRKSWKRHPKMPPLLHAFSKDVRTSWKGFPAWPILQSPVKT